MDKIKEFLQRNLKVTLVVTVLGVGVVIGYTADGCSVNVAQELVTK